MNFGAIASSLLRIAVSALSTSEGSAGAATVTGNVITMLGGTQSDGTKLLLKYGYQAVGSILQTWSGPTLSDDDVRARLTQSLGKDPAAFDLAKLWTGGV